jgi:hypothetical protein
VVTSETGVGAVAGYAVASAGVGLAAHGFNTAANGMRNLLNNNGRVYANTRPANRTANVKNGNSAASTKPSGHYEIKFQSGKTYNGVGPKSRMKQSAKKFSILNNDPVVNTVHTPTSNRREAYIQEHLGIERNGGAGNTELNYNTQTSPGKKLLGN